MKKSKKLLKEIAEELGYLNEQPLNPGVTNTQTIQGGQCAGDIITDYTLNSGDYGSLVGAFAYLVNNYGMSADFRNYAFPNTNGGYSNLEIDINMGGSSTMYFSIEAVHEAFGQGPFTSVGALFNYQNYTGGSISLGAISCTNVGGVDNSLPTTGLEPAVGTGTSGTGVAPGMKPTDTLVKTLQKRANIKSKR